MTGIQVDQLVKTWGTTRAVDGVTFDVPQGTLTVLLGPSGCGKSTILRMIAGLESASSGTVRINSSDVTSVDAAKRGVSMVFQSYALFPHLNVRENILFGLKVRRINASERQSRLDSAARMVGLEQLLDRKPAQLSGGQRQRVALARTIVAKQPVCLMDEPLSNLDARLRAEMRDEIQALQRQLELTMVYVTHDQTEAMSMADQIILLNQGQIVQTGTPEQLYDQPATDFAARFLGTPPMNLLPAGHLAVRHPASATEGFIGIRPEHISLTENGLPVNVNAVDYMGAETVLRLQYRDNPLMARIDGKTGLKPGQQIHIDWNDDDTHFFGRDGNRLAANQSGS